MNNTGRKAISQVSQKVGNMKGEMEAVMQEIENLKGEKEDYKENILENM